LEIERFAKRIFLKTLIILGLDVSLSFRKICQNIVRLLRRTQKVKFILVLLGVSIYFWFIPHAQKKFKILGKVYSKKKIFSQERLEKINRSGKQLKFAWPQNLGV